MRIGFEEALVVVGLLLIAGATASGLARRTVLSLTVLATAAGMLLDAVSLVDVTPGADSIIVIVELVLLVTLFSDGLLVEQGLLRQHSRPAARALVIAMPLNAMLLAGAAMLLFNELTWAEALLLGFLLSPTDPVVTSAIVASERVPQVVRHTLNLESGLNDGLALPFVLLFLTLSQESNEPVASAAGNLALQSTIGLGVGVALGLLVGALIGWLPRWAIAERYEGLVMLGTATLAYGSAELVDGNGLIAAFVAGVGLALLRPEAPGIFHQRNENVTNVLHLIAFAIFGAVIVDIGLNGSVPALAGFVVFALLVARPASVLVAFAGVNLTSAERAFVAWFGPKGIASMLFALFVLHSLAPDRTLLFEIAGFTILASVVAHGLTDTLGAARIAHHIASRDDQPPGPPSRAPEAG
jgi:NhaP-type Na+/H+ or K+/H+ antiporter